MDLYLSRFFPREATNDSKPGLAKLYRAWQSFMGLGKDLWGLAKLCGAFLAFRGFAKLYRGFAKLYRTWQSFTGLGKALQGLPNGCYEKLLPVACQEGAMENRHQYLAEQVRWKTVTNILPRKCDGKLSPTFCREGAMENRHQHLAEKV